MFNFSQIDLEIQKARETDTYKNFVSAFSRADSVGYVAHGGNLAIADHAAIDAARHSGKRCVAPGSGVVATSLFNDHNDDWQREWIKMTRCDAYVLITASASSLAFERAAGLLEQDSRPYIVISGRETLFGGITLDLHSYHEFEVAALAMTYNILNDAGYECPKI